MLFANTPKMVEDIARALPLWLRVPALRYYATAHALVTFYVGREVLGNHNDDFLRFKSPFPQGTNWEYSARVIHMAGILFELRSDPGFPEICRRMATRDLKQAHSELSAAAMFKAHGFTISARPETFKFGNDFDFSIAGPGVDANVEVWETDRQTFDADILRHRLGDKRKQLPSDKPAVLVCVFPELWFDQVDRLYDHFDALTARFLRSTRRINCVLFAHEEFADAEQGGMLLMGGYTVPHLSPRHACPALRDALLTGPDMHDRMQAFIEQPKGPTTIQTQHEFHRWVNWLIDGH
jgi:hypothetical protein